MFDRWRNRPDGLLPISTYFGYGVGQIGGQILRDTPALILPIYMTTVLGMEAALAGLVIIIAKFWVVAADPIAGIISDRTNTRWGRRRPFILGGGLLAAICFVLLFVVPDFSAQMVLFVYMTAIYLLLNTGYSLFAVPYLTMASEMSDNPNERTTILSFRNGCLALGLIIAGALAPKIVAYVMQNLGGTAREGYEWMGWVLGGVIAAASISVFIGTRTASGKPATEKTASLGEQLRIAWANKPFVVLITANIVQYISAGVGYAGGFFFMGYGLGLEFETYNVIPIWIIIISVASIAAMPPLVWAAARFGKMTVYKWCLILYSICIQAYWFSDADSLWIVWLVAVAIGLFNGGFILMSFSVLTDTVTYDRMRSGISREGALSSIYSAVDKVGNAIGGAIFLAMLSAVGFVESSDGSFPQQSEETIRGIWVFYVVVPALLHSGSIFILNRYKLPEADLSPRETG
ncbi:MAG: MFS transporter [Gammaproteobacteria bacterium]|nr:MFS transporter [Gammaproteobacteria bacterium]NND36263.1 MFS transporter [Gammaproteobacteria bacterium]